MKRYLTIGQTAKRVGLEVDTIRKLERAGKIRAVRTKGGHRRFTEEEIDRFRKSRRKSGSANTKPTGRRSATRRIAEGRATPNRHPRSGEFVARDVEFADGLDDVEEDLSFDEFDEELEKEVYQPPRPIPAPAQTGSAPMPQTPPPRPAVLASRLAPVAPAPVAETRFADQLRLQTIKGYGRSAIPWGVPAEWEGKVIADLERFVAPIQFPPDLSYAKAAEIVRARVAEVLRPYREAEEDAKRDKKAKEEADRRRVAHIAHGNEYARRETDDWDWSARSDARTEVEKVLNRDVEHDWTEHEVENVVDQVLDEWDDDEDEEGDDE